MIAMNRTNLQGQPFRLVEVFGRNATSIRVNGGSIVVNHSIRDIAAAWHRWVLGDDIQKAFHFLTPEERTFLQKGGG